jgi:AraC family transcriptional regulator of adaptative response / DNA-3-methyladenine glycosylase II
LDLDADPQAIDEALREDRLLRKLVRATPGRRVPGTVDGFELACRTILGQQVSLGAARTLAGRLAEKYGDRVAAGDLRRTWPSPATVAEADLTGFGIAPRRAASLRRLADRVAREEIRIDAGADRDETEEQLLEIDGIGPWTASYIRMRALRDPDVFLPNDLGVRRALKRLGIEGKPAHIAARWRPWRSYALQYLWTLA